MNPALKQALRQQRLGERAQRAVNATVPQEVPAPYGGLNTRDALNAMPATDAVKLDNWFPGEGFVSIREDISDLFDTGVTSSAVESIFEYYQSGFRQFIVAVGGSLYEGRYTSTGTADGTSANALIDSTATFATDGVTTNSIAINTTDNTYANVTVVTETNLTLDADIFVSGENYNITTPVGTGYTNDRWDAVNFNGVMPMVNGDDGPLQWDGTNITAPSWSGTGLTPSDLSGVEAHKFRLYFWTGVDQSFWYGAPNAISGILTEFDLSRVTGLGGNIINIKSWTIDSGAGPDDYLAILFSSGQVVVYQGSDPGDATQWALVGIYSLPEPVGGNRCAVKIGGDLKIITKSDIVSMTQTLRVGYEQVPRTKISGAMRTESATNASRFGWDISLHPEGHMLIINQPDQISTFNQFVQNTTTGAWCRFTGLNMPSWGRYNGDLICGDSAGKVYKLSGYGVSGNNIKGDAIQAWNALGMPFDKLSQQIRYVLATDGTINYGYKIGFDFEEITEPATTSVSSVSGSEWDIAAWDESSWSDGGTLYKRWRSSRSEGQYITSRLIVLAQQQVTWLKTDHRVTPLKAA